MEAQAPPPHPLSAQGLFDLRGWVAIGTLVTNGAKVYVTDSDPDFSQDWDLGNKMIIPYVLDTGKREKIEEFARMVEREVGFVNLLVNDVTVMKDYNTILLTPDGGPEEFGKASAINRITSANMITGAFLPLLARAREYSPAGRAGSVINNAAVCGILHVPFEAQFLYAASKDAATYLTQQMSRDLYHENIKIRVNGLATEGENRIYKNTEEYDEDEYHSLGIQAGSRMGLIMSTGRDLSSLILTLAVYDHLWGTMTVLEERNREYNPKVFSYDVDRY
ncbi:hypothetical protein GGS20DRAFT_598961 [Poronia punctata]|nr:hypothetical protein GGS20DRAFT_598961 [Poronia punctata]